MYLATNNPVQRSIAATKTVKSMGTLRPLVIGRHVAFIRGTQQEQNPDLFAVSFICLFSESGLVVFSKALDMKLRAEPVQPG